MTDKQINEKLWEIVHRLAWAPYAPENMVVAPSDSNEYAAYKENVARYYTRTIEMASTLTTDTDMHTTRLKFMQENSPTIEWAK